MAESERTQGADKNFEAPKSGIITREQSVLGQEIRFFGRHENSPAGILTTSDLRLVTGIYPTLAKAIIGVYGKIATPEVNQSSQDRYLNQYLAASLMKGELVSDEQAKQLSERVKEGEHSLQVSAYTIYLQEQENQRKSQPKTPRNRNNYFGYDDEDDDDSDDDVSQSLDEGDISSRKGKILSVRLGVESAMEVLYGEVDYKRVALTELLLQAPFRDVITSTGTTTVIDETSSQRHTAYLEEIKGFIDRFNPKERFDTFDETTQQYPAEFITENKEPEISDFDKEYIKSVYGFAKDLQEGNFQIENLYELFQQTLFRRGKHFVATILNGRLKMIPQQPEKASFSDIAGYTEQTNYFKTLVRRTAEDHPSMRQVKLVLLASRGGMGKSLTINAFFNALPENARGIMFDHKEGARRRDMSSALREFADLARLHPDLHVFAGIEDINTNEYLQDELLDVESIIPGNFPPNLHLVATTNYIERLPAPLLRPGRTSEILIYQPTKKSNERQDIVRLQAGKQGVALNPRAISLIANKTNGFTPDELAHVVRTLSLEYSENPNNSEIDKIVSKIKERRDLAKKLRDSDW